MQQNPVNTVTDARGASTTYGYNNRRLVNAINYGIPAGVAATSNVTFGYDAVGNRTSMYDGLGSVSYIYNTLSQMTSETRTFNGIGSFTISYGYNLAGQLSSIINPWGVYVGYSYDKTGRVTGVSGAGYSGVSTYASNLQYRAFGGLKAMSYGNSTQLGLQYDNRMRLKKWDVTNIANAAGNGYGYEYNYSILGDNSFRVSYAKNLYDSTLNRSYDYDHLGRLQVAHSGAEADAHVSLGSWGMQNGPYSHHYGYDQFGNLNYRIGRGGTNPSYTAAFTNNRLPSIQYDASGNMTDAGGGWVFQYDATGQQTHSAMYGQYMYYDGDSLRGKKTVGGITTYYLRSSVLGGQVIAELDAGGDWSRGYVYLGGQLLSIQKAGVYWMHQDPVTKGERVTDGSRNIVSAIELDPWGGETSRMVNSSFQTRWYTSYEMDENGSYEAMNRRYNRWWSRFEQPDPWDGSYDVMEPQSLNRYAYTQNDPVNFTDPSGLMPNLFPIWGASDGWGSVSAGIWGRGNLMNRPQGIIGGGVIGGLADVSISIAEIIQNDFLTFFQWSNEHNTWVTRYSGFTTFHSVLVRWNWSWTRFNPQEKPQLERNLSRDQQNFDLWNRHFRDCAIEMGIVIATDATLFTLGQDLWPKRFTTKATATGKGASEGTSFLSRTLGNGPTIRRVWAPTTNNLLGKTTRLGRAVSRVIPFGAAAHLGIHFVQVVNCANERFDRSLGR